MKTRIAIYAPTGTDGATGISNSKRNFVEPLSSLATRGGSTSVTIGALEETRTLTLAHTTLNRTCLPIPPREQIR